MELERLQADVRKFATMVMDGDLTGLIIVGPGGLGKSYSVLEAIKQRSLQVDPYNTHTSPLGLYEVLYHRRHERVVLLEDIEQVFRSTAIISLLRSALWGQKDKRGKMHRRVTWTTTSSVLDEHGLPPAFEFESGIIMIANELPTKSDMFNALMTRVPCVIFDLPPADIFGFMRKLVRRGQVIYDKLRECSVHLSHRDCLKVVAYLEGKGITDLRILDHALVTYYRYRDPDEWKRLVDRMLRKEHREQLPEERLVQELEEMQVPVRERVRLFQERTKRSRPTYFRIKARLASRPTATS